MNKQKGPSVFAEAFFKIIAQSTMHKVAVIVAMHGLRDLIPFDRVAGTMRAENRIRRIGQIGSRQIVRLLNDLVSIMTWSIASRQALQLSLSMRITAQHRGIVAHLGNWRQTSQ